MRVTKRNILIFVLLPLLLVTLFLCCLFWGSVDIPYTDVIEILIEGESSKKTWEYILFESRLPMAITALLSGAALSVAGLLLQTTFQNPLAGPSILGVSTGASLGVAVVMLGFSGFLEFFLGREIGQYVGILIGAMIGAGIIIALLLLFSSLLRNALMLLIIGIMISYLSSSAISLMNFFAPAEQLKSYVVWGLGSFSGVTSSQLPLFSITIVIMLLSSMLLIKPLNALLLGERYAQNMGYGIKTIRTELLVVSGLLTAIVTAFCGPIAFLGLIVPHVARLITNTSNHNVLLPATMLSGSVIALLCVCISVIPSDLGIMPINAITPIIGVPIIIYVIINRKRLNYFN